MTEVVELKNIRIGEKAIDFFKKNGKNIACVATVIMALMVPAKAKLEEKNEKLEIEQIEVINDLNEKVDLGKQVGLKYILGAMAVAVSIMVVGGALVILSESGEKYDSPEESNKTLQKNVKEL